MVVVRHDTVDLDDVTLQLATWGEAPVEIVLLHDGLGSIAQWRNVPADIAEATGVGVLAYERAGHGGSTPVPNGAWPTDWLHREARVLGRLFDVCDLDRPLVVGHSDGGSIALLHASAGGSCRGVVAIAAHSWVEPICRTSIIGMRESTDRWVAGLGLFHRSPAALFEAWSSVWVSDAFSTWDVRPELASIEVPTLVVQGVDDEYATDAQLFETARAIGAAAEAVHVPGGRHILHHGQPDVVPQLVAEFYDRVEVDDAAVPKG